MVIAVVALVPFFVTACGVTQYLSASYATDCLGGKGLTVTQGALRVPKDLKSGPRTREVTKLDIGAGPKDQFKFDNHAVIVVTPDDWDLGTTLMTPHISFSVGNKRIGPAPWILTGAYVEGFRQFVVVWEENPTPKQTKLVEGCLH